MYKRDFRVKITEMQRFHKDLTVKCRGPLQYILLLSYGNRKDSLTVIWTVSKRHRRYEYTAVFSFYSSISQVQVRMW